MTNTTKNRQPNRIYNTLTGEVFESYQSRRKLKRMVKAYTTTPYSCLKTTKPIR